MSDKLRQGLVITTLAVTSVFLFLGLSRSIGANARLKRDIYARDHYTGVKGPKKIKRAY